MTPRETRFRRARVVLFLVVAVCLTQIGWWIYFQIRESRRELEFSRRLGESHDVAIAQQGRRVRMALAEGGFLACALIGGVVSLYWLMNRELEREYEQSQLLAAVSHDFRSPLTAIRLIAQTLELGRASEADRARLSKTLVLNAKRLEDLVENVLAAARLHAGRIQTTLENVDLGVELERALEQRRDLFVERGAEVVRHVDRDVLVDADKSLLHSALGNLLDNAIKYSPEKPRLEVTVARAPAQDGAASFGRVIVKDHGLGFAPDAAERLFERFHRGDAEEDKSRPGLGLGLYLSRELVRLLGGEVSARSEGPGRGAEFELRLALVDPRRERGGTP